MPQKRTKAPLATRPNIPDYGISEKKAGMLPWKWAVERLTKSKQYWIATTRPDGSPHVMVIWGVWIDNEFWFSTGRKSRKARNLETNPKCVICSGDSAQAAIVEGLVEKFEDTAQLERVFTAYGKKYKMDIRGMGEPLFRLKPTVAFGLFEKKFTQTATKWKF